MVHLCDHVHNALLDRSVCQSWLTSGDLTIQVILAFNFAVGFACGLAGFFAVFHLATLSDYSPSFDRLYNKIVQD